MEDNLIEYEALLEKAKDFDNLRNGGIWRIVEELVEAVEDLLEENSFLATGKDSDKGFALGWKAAIEAAALWTDEDDADVRGHALVHIGGYYRGRQIRSIPMPADAQSALDRLTVQAKVQGMREAAEIARCHSDERPYRYSMDWNDGYIDGCRDAGEAIINRAEQIEKGLSSEQ